MLNVLRGMKYWNARQTAPAAPSYLFEALVVNYYASKSSEMTDYIDLEVPGLLDHVETAISGPVADPKRIQGDLNTLNVFERLAISQRANKDAKLAREARCLEDANDHRGAINIWRKVFGDAFPACG